MRIRVRILSRAPSRVKRARTASDVCFDCLASASSSRSNSSSLTWIFSSSATLSSSSGGLYIVNRLLALSRAQTRSNPFSSSVRRSDPGLPARAVRAPAGCRSAARSANRELQNRCAESVLSPVVFGVVFGFVLALGFHLLANRFAHIVDGLEFAQRLWRTRRSAPAGFSV